MAITVALRHTTSYKYAKPVSLGPQVIRLRPAPHCRSNVLSYGLQITPEDHFINWMQDPMGNYLARVVFPEKVSEFKVDVSVLTDIEVFNPFDFFLEKDAETFPFKYDEDLARQLRAYTADPVDTGPLWQTLFKSIDRAEKPTVDFLVAINQIVYNSLSYTIRLEPGIQTPEESLEKKSGSCRDSAWLMISLLRGLGLAARFASGYLIQLKADQPSIDGPSGADKDFTDLHAWAEVYLPGAGWVGLDPTSGLFAGEGHLPLACTANPNSAAPISGGVEEVETEFDFSMSVERVRDLPRATMPYTEPEWEAILQAGEHVDKRLRTQGVELTMGGEPTFISSDNPDAPEWNGAAVGAEKQDLSEKLLRRMWNRFAPGGLLHYGQGKWYPGESLPRWAYTCFWRADGKPIWKRPELLATLHEPGKCGPEEAKIFGEALAKRLGVPSDYLIPAYEDVGYYLWKERKLPANVTPTDNRLANQEERARIARIFDRGLDQPRGWTLPLKRQMWQGSSWKSAKWPVRGGHLYLIPGDSPIGLRLPLETLPWMDPNDAPFFAQTDPIAIDPGAPLPEQPSIPVNDEERFRQYDAGNDSCRQTLDKSDGTKAGASASWIVRTALCLEPRDGHLLVFFPPLPDVESYLELVALVEDIAAETKLKVILEGERPPHDPRILNFSITPDPGVVEVNVHPAASWKELCDTTLGVFDEAARCRLKPEKFMTDGRHTGSGGGCHMVMGGVSPAKSPFLKDPALLGSMLAYWQAHPSLSYLFSGLFVGPTSQSPRIDEARDDALYELEIALKELDRFTETPPPWIVDRLFRNLLTDITGNTHRAEFCIDKLYSPDRSSGRLGLLEMRSFEMPPHPRMNLALQLLLRALLAMLKEKPFRPHRLTRWGTQLHDRFMLPQFALEDFSDVVADLQAAGYPIEKDWYDAHFDFRYPLCGKFEYREIKIELRQAIEPWHTLGEEATASGTSRYVDSSLERLQVKASNFIPDRYELRCNQVPLPLTASAHEGAHVCGLRYRAWQPPHCLHPTIPVDTPLIFDLVDKWTNRSVAGCRYHSSHPGGRSFDNSPINSLEAEGRWRSKFDPFGHTPGPAPEPRTVLGAPEFPFTLDLRRAR